MRLAAGRMQLVYPQDSCYTQLILWWRIMRGIVHQSGAKRSTEHSVLILRKPAPAFQALAKAHPHCLGCAELCSILVNATFMRF